MWHTCWVDNLATLLRNRSKNLSWGWPRARGRYIAPWLLALGIAMAACSGPSPLAPTKATETPAPGDSGSSATPPTITRQPDPQSIARGQTAMMSVRVTGSEPMSYQWFAGDSGNTSAPVAGATEMDFVTPALTTTTTFWVRVSNIAGSVDSSAATVTVSSPSAPSPPAPSPPAPSPPAPSPPAPSPPPPSPPPPSGSPSLEDQVLVLVNQRRASGATCGGTPYPAVAPLTLDAHLAGAARGHSQDMAANNYFSHTSLDGRTFAQRIWQSGYTGGFPIGENIAGGQSSAQAAVDGWMQSPGHCQNIMNGGFRSTGIGYAFNPSATYRHYWTQAFGG